MVTDVVLLQRYAATRDADAFAEIVRRYASLVYNVSLRVTGNPQDAEDIAQACFLELARKPGSIKSSLPGWLHKVAKNRSVNAIRDNSTRRRYEVEALNDENASSEPTWADILPYVDEAVERLSSNLQEPVILHYFVGLSQAEVAEKLGVSQSTVSRMLQHAVAELREHLREAGVVVSVVVLASLLPNSASAAVPVTLLASLGKMAVSGVGVAKITSATGWSMLTKVAVLFVLIAICVGAGHGVRTYYKQENVHSGVPSVELIAEALEKQDKGYGKSIEVSYRYRVNTYGGAWHIRYIRASEVQFLEELHPSGDNIKASMDNSAVEFRMLRVTPKGKKYGEIRHDDPNTATMIRSGMPMEMIRMPIDDGNLVDGIRRGSVAAKRDNIDGHSCWRVEFAGTEDYIIKYKVWVDPSIGWCPRRIEINYTRQRPAIKSFMDYKQIANGVYFPMQIVKESQSSIAYFEADQVHIGKYYAPNDLIVDFPSGTKVYDKSADRTYIVP